MNNPPPATLHFRSQPNIDERIKSKTLFSLVTLRFKLLICLICADVHTAAKCRSALRLRLKCRCICAQRQANRIKKKSVSLLHMSHFIVDAPTKPNGLFSLFSVRHMDRAYSPLSLGSAQSTGEIRSPHAYEIIVAYRKNEDCRTHKKTPSNGKKDGFRRQRNVHKYQIHNNNSRKKAPNEVITQRRSE